MSDRLSSGSSNLRLADNLLTGSSPVYRDWTTASHPRRSFEGICDAPVSRHPPPLLKFGGQGVHRSRSYSNLDECFTYTQGSEGVLGALSNLAMSVL